MRISGNIYLSVILLGLYLITFGFSYSPHPKEEEKLFYPTLVSKFYQQNQSNIFWYASSPGRSEMRKELINCIDTAINYGLLSQPYHYIRLKENVENIPEDSASLSQADRVFTDAAIGWMKDIYQGYKIGSWIGSDQVSSKYENNTNEFLLSMLTGLRSGLDVKYLMMLLEPREKEYKILKQELMVQKQLGEKGKIKQLELSMNFYRWIHHFDFDRTITVNIASAYLNYYEKKDSKLFMKVIVGKPSTPTPRFAAWCDQVILYPYWYMPRKIALNEYLYRFKKNPGLIDALNMQIIDKNGKIVDHYGLNWSSFSKTYFPFTVRQCTGCDNALGVIKFNLTSPYSVYLHDTNNKTAFLSGYRYYSHGCIRIEEPIALGNFLLNNKLDTSFLQACYKEMKPVPIKLVQDVPVFVIYMPAEVSITGTVKYYKDVYKLLK